MRSILITGGAGFIGVNSARYFSSKGWQVTVVDNLSRRGTNENLTWLQAECAVHFERADIRDATAMDRIVGAVRPDVLLHLAAQVAVTTSVANPREDFEINALGTFNVMRLAAFKMLLERAARGCVQCHLARLETLALADTHAAGTVVHGDVGNLERGDLADAQPGLQHELCQRVVPRREAVGGGAGSAKQRVNLDVGQADRLAVANSTHGPNVMCDVGSQRAGAARPSA